MREDSRRFSRRGAISLGLAVVAGAAIPVRAAASVRLPPGPCILTRRLTRSLSDNAVLSVTRRWSVQFVEDRVGIRLDGHQIGVEVDAPARIAALADIERRRIEETMFPVRISPDGLISSTSANTDERSFREAIDAAQTQLRAWDPTAAEKDRNRRFMAAMQAAGGTFLAQLPADLFFPRGEGFHELRAVDLPDGSHGEFEVNYTAIATAADGWLDKATRSVETRLANGESRSVEQWHMGTG